jgi:aldehyde:ferredoxin oxidoreductase
MISHNDYSEIKPKKKLIKQIYVWTIMLVFGRAFQAASRVDKGAKEEFEAMPKDFMLDFYVMPNGPHMVVGKDEKGRIRYFGWNPAGRKITLYMGIKHLEAGIKMFTFQESSCTAVARDRLEVDGDLPVACGVLRIMDLLEVLLLPKIAAKLGVKRYPKWSQMSPLRKWASRLLVYVRLTTG